MTRRLIEWACPPSALHWGRRSYWWPGDGHVGTSGTFERHLPHLPHDRLWKVSQDGRPFIVTRRPA